MMTIAASQDPGSIRAAKSAGPFVGGVALVVAAASIGCLVIFETASFLGFAIHADTLHLALQTWDYSSHDYALEGFSMSRAPSLVPDLVVYGAVQLATGSWRVASLAYGVLSLIGLAIAAGAVVRKVARCDWRMATQTFLLPRGARCHLENLTARFRFSWCALGVFACRFASCQALDVSCRHGCHNL